MYVLATKQASIPDEHMRPIFEVGEEPAYMKITLAPMARVVRKTSTGQIFSLDKYGCREPFRRVSARLQKVRDDMEKLSLELTTKMVAGSSFQTAGAFDMDEVFN